MSMPMRLAMPDTSKYEYNKPRLTRSGLHAVKKRPLTIIIGGLIFFALGIFAALSAMNVFNNIMSETSLILDREHSGGSELAISAADLVRNNGYISVTGSVISHMTKPASRVEAVVELQDKQAKIIKVESAMVSSDPMRPGETSLFCVEMPDDPRAVSFRIHFKQLFGRSMN